MSENADEAIRYMADKENVPYRVIEGLINEIKSSQPKVIKKYTVTSAVNLLSVLIDCVLTQDTKDYGVHFSGIMDGHHIEDLGSWRGSYDVLSASYMPDHPDESLVRPLRLGFLVKYLSKYSKGAVLHGHKGGTYTARMGEYLYVANSGQTMPGHLYHAGLRGYVAVTGYSVDHDKKIVYLDTTDTLY